MDSFVLDAQNMRVRSIFTKALLNGLFFVVSLSWADALKALIANLFDDNDSIAALFTQAVVVTLAVTLTIAATSSFVWRGPVQGVSRTPRVIAEIGSSSGTQSRSRA